MADKFQWFKGVKFTRDEHTGYYQNSTLHIRMHQYVWKSFNGDIPEGYEVHHKDLDRSNNDISNLQLLTVSEHKALHASLLTDEQRDWKRDNLAINARPKAAEWHKSEEGKNWHSEHIRQQREKGSFIKTRVCMQCGKEFKGEYHGGKYSFCSPACGQKYRRDNNLDNEDRVCIICGKTFSTLKYKDIKTCSRECAGTLRWRNIRESKAGKKNKSALFGVRPRGTENT